LFLLIPSCPKLWVWHTGEKIGNCDMAMILDEAFALLLLENYWESWSTKMWKNTRQKFCTMKAQTKKRKGKQPGVNSIVVLGVQIVWGMVKVGPLAIQ